MKAERGPGTKLHTLIMYNNMNNLSWYSVADQSYKNIINVESKKITKSMLSLMDGKIISHQSKS